MHLLTDPVLYLCRGCVIHSQSEFSPIRVSPSIGSETTTIPSSLMVRSTHEYQYNVWITINDQGLLN